MPGPDDVSHITLHVMDHLWDLNVALVEHVLEIVDRSEEGSFVIVGDINKSTSGGVGGRGRDVCRRSELIRPSQSIWLTDLRHVR